MPDAPRRRHPKFLSNCSLRPILRRPIFQLEPIERRVLLASVSGNFFVDANANGVRDTGEAGAPGWTVFLDENQNGTFDGTSVSLDSTNVPLRVPPSGTAGITTSTLDVSGVGTVSGIVATIGNLTHTFDGDLIITLISPAGTRVTLSNRRGGSGDNFINTVFDDNATVPISSGVAPFTGTFRPEQPLANFSGQNADGQWRIEINDAASGDSGFLNAWSLTFSSGERSGVSDANGNYNMVNVAAGTYDVRQVDRAGWNQTAPPGGFYTVTLDATTNATNLNFGNRQPPGSISGYVFSDYNSNGQKDANEPGLAGWSVYLDLNDNATREASEPLLLSDATGFYSFPELQPRLYVVREILQSGYVQTHPGSGGVILDVGPLPTGEGDASGREDRSYTQTEVVVAFQGAQGLPALAAHVSRDQYIASLVDLGSSRDMFFVNNAALVEVKLRSRVDPLKAVDAFQRLGNVRWAQVNYIYDDFDPRELIPNDPQYASQYHHPLMQNNLAWDTTMGDPRIVIGVTDDGNDFEHQDLYLNIWINQAEIPPTRLVNLTDLNGDGYISFEELNNPVNMGPFKAVDVNSDGRISGSDLLAAMVKDGSGNDTGAGGWSDQIDQGGNTYVDDLVGRDFWNNDNDSRPPSGATHGTHVMGISSARTDNGVGVAGTAGRTSIMPIRFYATSGGTWTSTIISNSYRYGTDNGAKIVNTSYNVDSFSNDMIFAAALDYMYAGGVLHFNSAGNNGQLNPPRQKWDQSLFVVNTQANDTRASTSNYGWGVDLTAPGTNILSTYPNNVYQSISGTSMAAPNAAGVAALIWSANPTWTREQVVAQLLGTADNIDAQNPAIVGLLGAGRANSFRALTETIAPPKLKSLIGLPSEGGTILTKPASFTLDVANVFDPATMNPGIFEMRGSGIDGVFGTGDDQIIPLTLVFGGASTPDYKFGTNRLFFSIPGPMGSDTYRFTMSASATDPFGQPLDGNGDGVGGDAFVRTFILQGPTNPYRITLDPDEHFVDVNFGNHDRVPPKVLASSFAFLTSQALVVQFNEDVQGSVDVGDLELDNLTTGQPVSTAGFTISYDSLTHTATFHVNGILPDGDYAATLSGNGISDPSTNQLDGDGNGVGGDDYSFNFFFLQGDANRDRVVNLEDFNILAANFGQSGTDFSQANFNYDSGTTLDDFNILAAQFGKSLDTLASTTASGGTTATPLATTTRGRFDGGGETFASTRGGSTSLFGQTRIGQLRLPGERGLTDVLLDEQTGKLVLS